MNTKYWHVVYEVSGKPPRLAVGDRTHNLDIGFSSSACSFPIQEARKSIEALYRDTETVRHNFMPTAIISWTEIDEAQYASLSADNNTAETRQAQQERESRQLGESIKNDWLLGLLTKLKIV